MCKSSAKRVQTEMGGDPSCAAELGIIIGESFSALGLPDEGRDILNFAIPIAEKEFGHTHVLTLRGRAYLASITLQRDPAKGEALTMT